MLLRLFSSSIVGLAIWTTISANLACQSRSSEEKQSLQKQLELASKLDRKIDFYGVVLDDHDTIVEGAEVILAITQFTPNPASLFLTVRMLHAKTDAQGRISIRGERGIKLSIDRIQKKGYAWLDQEKTSFDYSNEITPFISDPKNPVVLRMRKKGDVAFVLTGRRGNFSFMRQESGFQKGWDFVADREIAEKFLEHAGERVVEEMPLTCDLKAKATYDEKKGTWTLLLSAGGAGGGILASDKLLYLAPRDGYQPTYLIQHEAFLRESGSNLTASGTDKRGSALNGIYLYLRHRNPPLYSRIRVGSFNSDEERIVFRGGDVVTNPYGDRNFEEATELPEDVIFQLRQEVREAFKHGTRPPKPDLPKLVEEWEKTRPLKDKLKDWFKK